jgi:hypothetical protein
MNLENLRKFIIESNKKGYASGKAGKKEEDGSYTIIYESGNWKSHDNYFGGEPYGGRTIVSFKNKPFWLMAYWGRVNELEDPKKIYPFLQKALMEIPEELPLRGPGRFKEGDFEYQFEVEGGLVESKIKLKTNMVS